MGDSDSKTKKTFVKALSVESVLTEAVIILQRIVYFHADLVIELLFPVISSGILCLILMLIFNSETLEKLNITKSCILILVIICSKILFDFFIYFLTKYKYKKIVLVLLVAQCVIILLIDISVSFILFIFDISNLNVIDFLFFVLIFWNYFCFGILSMMWYMPIQGKRWFIIILAANFSFIMIKIIHRTMIWTFILISSIIDFIWVIMPIFETKEIDTINDLNVRLKYALVYTTLPITTSIILESSIANTSENNISGYYNSNKPFSVFNDFNNPLKYMKGHKNTIQNNINSQDTNKSALTQTSFVQNKKFNKKLRSYGLKEIKLLQNKCIKRIKSGVQMPVSSLLMHNLLFAVVGSKRNALALYYSFLSTFFCFLIKAIFHIHLEKSFPIQLSSLFLIYTIAACVTSFVTTHNEKNFLNSIYP